MAEEKFIIKNTPAWCNITFDQAAVDFVESHKGFAKNGFPCYSEDLDIKVGDTWHVDGIGENDEFLLASSGNGWGGAFPRNLFPDFDVDAWRKNFTRECEYLEKARKHEEQVNKTNWFTFRNRVAREMLKTILTSPPMISAASMAADKTKKNIQEVVATMAVGYTDALIAALKEFPE